MTSPEPLVSATDVSKVYRSGIEEVLALDGLDFSAAAGSLTCIMGASGSGKSTFLKVLAGLERTSRGRVVVSGQDLHRLDENHLARLRLTTIGMIHQDILLVPDLSVAQNVAVPLLLGGAKLAEVTDQVEEALARVGVADLKDRYPDELSGGQAQRCGIARALCGDRQILLADEPTGSLDTKRSLELFGLFRDLADSGRTVVLCTHDPRAAGYATTVMEMVDGRLYAVEA